MKSISTKKEKVKGRPKTTLKNNDNFKTLRIRLLEERKLTLDELSEKTKISKSSLNYFENGERKPSLDDLISISKALNISMDYLLGLQDSKSKDITINSISKTLNINDESINSIIYNINSIDDERAIRIEALNELLSSYDFKEFLFIFDKYLNYEYYYDSEKEEIWLDDIMFHDKEDLYLMKLTEQLQKIKNNSSISEKKYKDIIKELKNLVNISKDNKNNHIREWEYDVYSARLKQYESKAKNCESSRKIMKVFIYSKENKNGKK